MFYWENELSVEFPNRFELGQGISLKEQVRDFEKRLVLTALEETASFAGAARLLGLKAPSLKEVMKRLGLCGSNRK